MGKFVFGVIAVACLLTAAGCGAGSAPASVCSQLMNCPGAENLPADFAEACPLAMMGVQFAFPECYQCLSNNVCDPFTACETQCASVSLTLPGS